MSIVSAPQLLVDGVFRGPGAVTFDAGRITAVLAHVPAPAADHTELTDGILTAGLVDLQLNGFVGHDLAAADEGGWVAVRRALPRTGVTSFVATYLTAPVPELLIAMARAERASRSEVAGAARVLGVHLEGPFLAQAYRGAHDPAHMTDPDAGSIEAIVRRDVLVAVTLAPERRHALAAIERLSQTGVLVCLGHSDATAEQASAGIEAGARMVTHLFNAMRPMSNRDPGLAGVALTDDRVAVGLICDLQHVDPLMCSLAFRAAPGRVVLVTDAVSAAGMPPGRYELGGASVELAGSGELPRRTDGTIAGSSLTLAQAVRNAVSCGLEPAAALAAASELPARVLGRGDVGVLAPGARADMVWWSPDLHPRRAWVGGAPIEDGTS